MADVLIVNPPSPDEHIYIRDMCRWGRKSREKMVWPQSSLAYLAAMVPEDLSVRIIDAIAEEMTPDDFFAKMARERPRFYVTYVTGTTFAMDAMGVAKAKQCGATTIAVGTHVSAVPQNTMELIPKLDFVLRHEPEMTFRDVMHCVLNGQDPAKVTGLAYRRDGKPVVTPDRPLLKSLDELPIPR